MDYILNKAKYMKINIKIIFIIFISFFMTSYSNNLINQMYIKNLEQIKFITFYSITINDLWIYYIPFIAIYLYFLEDFSNYKFEKFYIYKFKNKLHLIKINLFLNLITSFFYTIIFNFSIICFIANKIKFSISKYDIIYLITSIIIQSLVIYIYSIICISVDYFFQSNNNINVIVTKVFILFIILLNSFSEISTIPYLSLYNYFTIERITITGKNTLFVIFIMLFIIYLFIETIEVYSKKLEYIKQVQNR